MPATDVPLKPYKKEFAHSYSFGVFPTLELLEARPNVALKILLSEAGRKNSGVRKIEQICERKRIHLEVNDRAVERLSPKENAYAVGVFRKYECALNPAADHLVLVNPSDMGNLGTIIRTMRGFGMADLALVRPAADIFDPRVVRASMGALFRVAFSYYDTFGAYETEYSRTLYPFMTGTHRALAQTGFRSPFSLVFGSESSGLPKEYATKGTPVTIPHSADIDSLNLTIAVALGLYEATKGRFTE